MNAAQFDELQSLHATQGPGPAIDQLCKTLEEKKDYSNLFYALLMKKRSELGVSPIPTTPSSELPPEYHATYEEAIRNAAHYVGQMCLRDGRIPDAWVFYRMLGEKEPVVKALDNVQLLDGEDCQDLITIAFHEGVHPQKGFDLLLDRYGLCSAITTVGGQEFRHDPDTRDYCLKRLVRALYHELVERLQAEIERTEGKKPTTRSVPELIANREWLFGEDFYCIDVSHLSSVVQMAMHLSPCPELDMVRELCQYGQRLSSRFQYPAPPPFDDQYKDYGIYFAILAGDDVEAGLAHFRAKAEQDQQAPPGMEPVPESEAVAGEMPMEMEGGGSDTYPAEVLVNLLLRLERPKEALEIARKYLVKADERRIRCPGIVELCQRVKDFRTLAEVAREQNNPVHFVAGLIAAAKK